MRNKMKRPRDPELQLAERIIGDLAELEDKEAAQRILDIVHARFRVTLTFNPRAIKDEDGTR